MMGCFLYQVFLDVRVARGGHLGIQIITDDEELVGFSGRYGGLEDNETKKNADEME
jgi:hypothetical protein